MRLKGIEIQGFKSFPEKVILPFEKQVIAIVGPNGSGKSNISDAICWVMGEQRSKTLRGAKMEDVIFGGTAQRGPSGFAQVSLILGNEDRSLRADADEVTITRRYYRSGESEYYINKQSVRLKDVNELLMDTGLGRDGYSLVGQGRVDEILAARSTDRREIFEEAAGISKYRHKKEETERKLERTGENLLRVGDKISELELQVEPLRKQAETARRYLLLRDELRGLEISLWMDALDKLTEKTRALNQDYEVCGSSLNEGKETQESLYQESEECSRGIREADEAAEALRGRIGESEKEAAALESEAADLTARQQSNLGSLVRLEEEQDRQKERESELRQKIREREERLEALEGALRDLTEERETLFSSSSEASSAVDEASAAADALIREAAGEEAAAAAEEARREALRNTLESMDERLEELRQDLERQRQRLTEEETALEEAELRLKEQTSAAEAARNTQRGYELRLKARQQKLASLTEELRSARLEESGAQARFRLLSDMEKEYEGFSRAVRTVMRERDRGNLKHIHGTVAQLIRTEDRYTVAIETALGNGLQSIVVDREEDGKAAILLLKRQDAGRATFLPMSTMRGSELREPGLAQMPGVEGLASSLVEYDEAYRGIILYQLGRTVVARDLDAAIAVSRRFGGRLRIVTLDGQLIQAGGSMTGGSAARNVGALSRSNELERLREKLAELRETLEKRGSEAAAAEKEAAAAAFSAETAAGELRSAEDACLRLRSETEQRRALTDALRESVETAEKSLGSAGSEKEALLRGDKQAEQAAEEHRRKAEELRARAAGSAQDREALAARLRALTEKATALQAREAALETEKTAGEESIREWQGLLQGLLGDRESRDALRQELLEKNGELERQMAALRDRASESRASADVLRPRLSAQLSRRQDFEARRSRIERNAQDLNRRIIELEREYASLEQKKNAADMEEKQLLDKLWDSYELSRSAAARQRLPLENLGQAQKRAGQLRREISSLGTPNLGAIEEFERVNERYTFLTGQRDDIEKARDELVQIIAELTGEMEKIFRREFESVARSFSETFTELFGGGRGELILEDPEDILNCGIEIRVQPPGKALKTLTLLSGGERAFVAIALYFAMLKVRPAPFCVLDEIESALDEANVNRFAAYTRRMSDSTQFLIITHRRGSMEAADMLYGVTMQKGISRVLSVELGEALKTSAK
ncbi:MAG: chromosome segregation protein SMC [Oscillospiraceae bacterium]|nr:chromosome segregation protein SMC [Oscillospiraceae bacterium]